MEITESQELDQQLVAAAIELCHRHGIRVALDDFGTGYSHLTQMHKLGFDTLKLDQAFSREHAVRSAFDGDRRSDRRGWARPCTRTSSSKAWRPRKCSRPCAQLGCDYAQGYLIGRPQTLDELIAGKPGVG